MGGNELVGSVSGIHEYSTELQADGATECPWRFAGRFARAAAVTLSDQNLKDMRT
jgi:hypothetical protein